MMGAGHNRLEPGGPHPIDHLGRVAGDHHTIHDIQVGHTPGDPGDQRLTGQELQRFVGESRRAQSGRDDAEDAHHGS